MPKRNYTGVPLKMRRVLRQCDMDVKAGMKASDTAEMQLANLWLAIDDELNNRDSLLNATNVNIPEKVGNATGYNLRGVAAYVVQARDDLNNAKKQLEQVFTDNGLGDIPL